MAANAKNASASFLYRTARRIVYRAIVRCAVCLSVCPSVTLARRVVEAKFHYATWFEACRRPASKQLA